MIHFSFNTNNFFLFVYVLSKEPTQAFASPKTEAAQASLSVTPEKESKMPSDTLFSPSVALLRLLQTAFNRQSPALQQPQSVSKASFPAQRKQQLSHSFSPTATRLPPKMLYQALDLINKFQGPENSVYSDYTDGFYSTKPYRHRDDRLLQALIQMLENDRK